MTVKWTNVTVVERAKKPRGHHAARPAIRRFQIGEWRK